jgi:hypothetical protein
MIGRSLIFALILCVTECGAAVAWPLRIAGSHRHLEDQNGVPFFIMGEACWSRIIATTRAEWESYLSNRAAKGWNTVVVQIEAYPSYLPNPPYDVNGNAPFDPPSSISNQVEAYYAHIDGQIQSAKDFGFLVIVVPLYSGWRSDGWISAVLAASDDLLYAHGRFLGARYHPGKFGNVLWMIGHDLDEPHFGASMATIKRRYERLKSGIRTQDDITLMSAGGQHDVGNLSSDSYFSDPIFNDFIQVDNLYSWEETFSEAAKRAWSNGIPFWGMEGKYENESATQLRLRTQSYHSVFGGACGTTTYGEGSLWNGAVAWSRAASHLNDPGAVAQGHVGALMRSRAWTAMVPDTTDTFVVSAKGTGATAIVARYSDETGMVYLPLGSGHGAVTVDVGQIAGATGKFFWFNPRNGTASLIGVFPTTGSKVFTPPDSEDWVLVVDDESQGLGPPGKVPASAQRPVPPLNLRVVEAGS